MLKGKIIKYVTKGYSALFFLALFAALCANSLFKITWPNEYDAFLFRLYDFLWLLSYVSIILLGVVSIYFQISRLCETSVSEQVKKSDIVKQLLLIILILVACAFSYKDRETSGLFVLIPLAPLSWLVSKKKTSFFVLLFQVFYFIFGFVLLFLNFTEDFVYFEHGTRHTLGFQHPNNVGMWVASIVMLFGLYKSNKKSTKLFVIGFTLISAVISVVTFYFTKSRTSLIAIFLFLAIYDICWFLPSFVNRCFELKTIRFSFEFLPTLCFLISVVLGYLFDAIEEFKNSNFSYRFYTGIYALEEYGLKFSGLRPWGFVVDNGYFAMLLYGGMVFFICYEIIAVCSCMKVSYKREWGAIAYMTALYFYMMMENYWLLLPIMFVGIIFAFPKVEIQSQNKYFD